MYDRKTIKNFTAVIDINPTIFFMFLLKMSTYEHMFDDPGAEIILDVPMNAYSMSVEVVGGSGGKSFVQKTIGGLSIVEYNALEKLVLVSGPVMGKSGSIVVLSEEKK